MQELYRMVKVLWSYAVRKQEFSIQFVGATWELKEAITKQFQTNQPVELTWKIRLAVLQKLYVQLPLNFSTF